MNIVLTNKMSTDLPVMSTDEGGWCETLPANGTLTVYKSGSDVVVIGDKPDVGDVVKAGVEAAGKLVKKLRDFIAGQPQPKKGDPSATQALTVTVGNNGPAALRVILGDGQTDEEIAPGDTFEAVAPGYIELRELGHAPQQGGTPD